jgi:hypothetical protein
LSGTNPDAVEASEGLFAEDARQHRLDHGRRVPRPERHTLLGETGTAHRQGYVVEVGQHGRRCDDGSKDDGQKQCCDRPPCRTIANVNDGIDRQQQAAERGGE